MENTKLGKLFARGASPQEIMANVSAEEYSNTTLSAYHKIDDMLYACQVINDQVHKIPKHRTILISEKLFCARFQTSVLLSKIHSLKLVCPKFNNPISFVVQ